MAAPNMSVLQSSWLSSDWLPAPRDGELLFEEGKQGEGSMWEQALLLDRGF